MTHILIIDDDIDFQDALQKGFKKAGYEATGIFDQFVDKICLLPGPVDYVVLDLNLSGLSGLELIPVLIEQFDHPKILVLTGYASISTAIAAIKAGAHHYLIKPALVKDMISVFESDGLPEDPESQDPISLDQKEWELIQSTLESVSFNVSQAAKQLGIHRRSLQRKLKKKGFFN